MRILQLFCLIFLVNVLLKAQDSDQPDIQGTGDQAFQSAEYEKALSLYIQASETLEDQQPLQKFRNDLKILDTYLKLNDFDKAEKQIDLLRSGKLSQADSISDQIDLRAAGLSTKRGDFDQALEILNGIAGRTNDQDLLLECYLRMGLVQVTAYDIKEAQVTYDKILALVGTEVSDPHVMSEIKDLEGRIKWHIGDFRSALYTFEDALTERLKVVNADHPDIGELYGYIGIMYKNLNQYDKALEYYGLAIEIRKKYLGEDHIEVSDTYNNIGYALYKKDLFNEAMEIHRKALNIRQNQLPKNHPKVLQSIEHIGLNYGGLEEFEEAEKYFQRILEARIARNGRNYHMTGYALYNLGAVADADKDFEKAAGYFKEAVEIGYEVYGPHNYDQADNFNRLANSYLRLGRYTESRENFHKALQHNLPGYQWDGTLDTIPDLRFYLSFREVFRSLIGLADVYRELGGKPDLENSIKYIGEAESLLEKFRRSITREGDLITLSATAKQLADCAMMTYHKWNELEKDSSNDEMIFRFSELSKASAVLRALEDDKAKNSGGISQEFLEYDKALRLEKDSLNNKILATLNGPEEENETLNSLKGALFDVSSRQELFLDSLERLFPAYASMRYGLKPVSILNLKQHLAERENTILIQYHYTDQQSLFTLMISNDTVLIDRLDSVDLADAIMDFRQSMLDQRAASYGNSANTLFRKLIDSKYDLLKSYTNWIVIPDGLISYLPFDLLINDSGQILIEEHNINYDLSASVLLARINRRSESKNGLLAYAPEFKDQETTQEVRLGEILVRSQELSALPGAMEEATEIANLFGGTLRLGKDATETRFREEVSDYSLVHLATHSVINQSDPDYSMLVFNDNGRIDDGRLHAFELSSIELNARLVTLSACNTGFGRIKEGEGVMSMARSFSSAGVGGVVMSLWPASDKSTPMIMSSFYRNLKEGKPVNVSMREAKLEYLSNASGKSRHPFFWGNFILIGDSSPIEVDDDAEMWVLILIIGLGLPVAIVLFRRVKAQSKA